MVAIVDPLWRARRRRINDIDVDGVRGGDALLLQAQETVRMIIYNMCRRNFACCVAYLIQALRRTQTRGVSTKQTTRS